MGKTRDRFMAEAMGALIISKGVNNPGPDSTAKQAAQYADAMMQARAKDRKKRRQARRGSS